MTAVIRSLADSLRRFGDDRLEALLVARPDLASPLPKGIGPLAARAAGAGSARRAMSALTLPELHLVEALAVLSDGVSPRDLAAAERDLGRLTRPRWVGVKIHTHYTATPIASGAMRNGSVRTSP